MTPNITLHGSVRVRGEQCFVALQWRALLSRACGGGLVGGIVLLLLLLQRLLMDDCLDNFSTGSLVRGPGCHEVLIDMSSSCVCPPTWPVSAALVRSGRLGRCRPVGADRDTVGPGAV